MDLKAIKELAQKFTVQELENWATELEQKGQCSAIAKTDANEAMSDVLQAMEVRKLVDGGSSLQEATREFSKRVRSTLS